MKRLILLLLCLLSLQVQSATTPLQSVQRYGDMNGLHSLYGWKSSAAEVCAALGTYYGSMTLTATGDFSSGYKCVGPSSPGGIGVLNESYMGCPSGWTPQDGGCYQPDPDPCQAKQGNTSLVWMSHNIGATTYEGQSYCDNGCTVGVNAAPAGYSYTNGKVRLQRYELVQMGGKCSNGTPLPTPVEPSKEPPTPPKKPLCAATEGVLTSSSGAVHCVPSGTPAASVPVVTKSAQTTTNPDGTKTTTETTTTRDPATGAEDKQTTTTTKDANGNVTGTTTTNTNTSSNNGGNPDSPNNSDFCQKNPGLQICKGGMNEEKTQIEVRDELKKLTNPGDTSYDPVKNATHSTESENALKAENDKFTDAAKGITDVTSTTRTSWQAAMDSGWFTAIPQSGCTPISGTVGGRNFTIDHCQKAAEISSIMSYGLWFSLVIGVFVMFTGGQVRSS